MYKLNEKSFKENINKRVSQKMLTLNLSKKINENIGSNSDNNIKQNYLNESKSESKLPSTIMNSDNNKSIKNVNQKKFNITDFSKKFVGDKIAGKLLQSKNILTSAKVKYNY